MYVIFIRNLFLNSSSEVISKLLLPKKEKKTKNVVCEIAIKLEIFLIAFKVYTTCFTSLIKFLCFQPINSNLNYVLLKTYMDL